MDFVKPAEVLQSMVEALLQAGKHSGYSFWMFPMVSTDVASKLGTRS
ncbi:hypothetical protein [Paenibacillus sp.]